MILPAGKTTVFDIRYPSDTAPGVPLYAARGLTGTLRPIDMAQGSDKLRRTVNGTLIDISAPQMRKYQLEASGEDQEAPAFDGLWPGMAVEVDCHVELAYMTASGGPTRTPVSGSVHTRGSYTFYCPSFLARVVELEIESAEWEARVNWSILLEEV
jgi:hypothetical protein